MSITPVLLAGGVKGVLEDPTYLLGIPLLVLGALGAVVALTVSGALNMDRLFGVSEAGAHPGPEVYARVGIVLAIVTAIEVALYYVPDMPMAAILGLLLPLSLIKFLLVVLWFMHLRFDNPVFSTLFTGGLALAIALFIVVLATLGANLV